MTNKEIVNAANDLLIRLNQTTDEELLLELENCEYGPFSQMIEDGFDLGMTIEQGRHDRSISN